MRILQYKVNIFYYIYSQDLQVELQKQEYEYHGLSEYQNPRFDQGLPGWS